MRRVGSVITYHALLSLRHHRVLLSCVRILRRAGAFGAAIAGLRMTMQLFLVVQRQAVTNVITYSVFLSRLLRVLHQQVRVARPPLPNVITYFLLPQVPTHTGLFKRVQAVMCMVT